MKRILLIVDPQNDFITGTLAVPGAKSMMLKLAEYDFAKYDYICVTMDSHPENHMSFKENGGIWPKHCVTYSNGWNLPDYLEDSLMYFSNESGKPVTCYHKGTNPETEEYSIFDNVEDGFTLDNQITDLLREGNIEIDICGIAGDYCVLETLKGLRNIVGDKHIRVLSQFTASIDHGVKLNQYLIENKIRYVY